MAGKGGAWKVAYADFVTAMMALFMVLWISSQDKEVLVATSRYFQQPFNSPLTASAGILNLDGKVASEKSAKSAETEDSTQGGKPQTEARAVDLQFLNSLAKDFYRLLHMAEDLKDKPIDIQVTTDGMRITLFDRASRPLFLEGTAEFTEWGRFVMQSLAWMIDRQKFMVIIDGHTRKGLALNKPDYGSWELSADRANAARRALTYYAVDPSLINRVTGYADTHPVPYEKPESETNQRVTISLSAGKREKPKPDKITATTPK